MMTSSLIKVNPRYFLFQLFQFQFPQSILKNWNFFEIIVLFVED